MAIKTFQEGEDIKASETNSNNQELLSKINDNASQLDSYVKAQINAMQSNINTVQSTLQTSINTNINDLKNKIPTNTNILSYIMPNWSKKVNRGTTYTLTEDCWVYLLATVGWSNTSTSSKAGGVCIGGGLGRGDSTMKVGGIWIGAKGDKITGDFTIYTVPFVGRG